MRRATLVFLLVMVFMLLSGTLKIGLLTDSYTHATLPIPGVDRFQDFLYNLVPYDAAKGEEGVTAQRFTAGEGPRQVGQARVALGSGLHRRQRLGGPTVA